MPQIRCPVLGCGKRKDEWGKRNYPLSSPTAFTLQLKAPLDVSVRNRICSKCWDRHKDHTISLDGRTRVVPLSSSSPLDALLSAISPAPPASLPSPPSLSSLPSPPPTPALALPCLQLPYFNRLYFHHLPAATQPSFARQQVACLQRGRGSRMRWQQRRVQHRMKARRQRLSSCAVA